MAKRAGREPAQVLIAWVATKGFSVIPKSTTPSRIESNFRESSEGILVLRKPAAHVFESLFWTEDCILSDEEFQEISALGRKDPVRYNTPFLYEPKWNINVFDSPEEKEAAVKVW